MFLLPWISRTTSWSEIRLTASRQAFFQKTGTSGSHTKHLSQMYRSTHFQTTDLLLLCFQILLFSFCTHSAATRLSFSPWLKIALSFIYLFTPAIFICMPIHSSQQSVFSTFVTWHSSILPSVINFTKAPA